MSPFAPWLTGYRRAWLPRDLLAGAALAGLLIPEALGYAAIAGLPPTSGLIGATVGLLFYGVLGGSRVLAVSPTTASAAMLAAAMGQLAASHPLPYPLLAALMALMAGLLFLAAGHLRLGFLSEFISKPVLKGFVFGIAIAIIIRQLPKLFGVEGTKGNLLRQLAHFVSVLDSSNLWDFGVGGTALALLFLFGRIGKGWPATLLVLILGILATRGLQLGEHGIRLVGPIRAPLAPLEAHPLPWEIWTEALPLAIGLALVLFAESLGAARNFAKPGEDDIDPNRELKALGLANLISGLCQAMPVGGGTSGTAANAAAGARSPLAAMTAAGLMLLGILVASPWLQDLPEPVLAAIIIHAVAHLADVPEFLRYHRLKTGELPIALTALVGVPVFGILPGLLIAMGLTLIVLLRNMSDPHLARLGRLPGTRDFVDLDRHPEAETTPTLLVIRLDKPLFFANANRVHSELKALLKTCDPAVPRAIILSFELTPDLDITSMDMLQRFQAEAASQGVSLVFARVKDAMRDTLTRSGFMTALGPGHFTWSVDEAVRTACARLACGGKPPAGDPRQSPRA